MEMLRLQKMLLWEGFDLANLCIVPDLGSSPREEESRVSPNADDDGEQMPSWQAFLLLREI